VETWKATILSRIMRLRLSYDGVATGAPASIILKTGLPERANAKWNPDRREVAFYNQIAAGMPTGLVPRCFEAVWEENTNDWHLLLEDRTDSHSIASNWPLPATFEQNKQIVVARARLHAAWWDDSRLGASIGTWLDPSDPQIQTFAEEVARFEVRVGDRLRRHVNASSVSEVSLQAISTCSRVGRYAL
jgi:hypothetical protein